MRLTTKLLVMLGLTILLPLLLLGLTAYRVLIQVENQAVAEAAPALLGAARERLELLTRAKALEIDRGLSVYAAATRHLGGLYLDTPDRPVSDRLGVPAYRARPREGLPPFGYVDLAIGAYADFDRLGQTCPWLPPRLLGRARTSEAFRERVVLQLHRTARLSRPFKRVFEAHSRDLDLIWIVLVDGPTNVYPPYNYRQVLAERPEILTVDEASQDYVRLLDPLRNPQRLTRWLEPYLDLFKGVWMTSCAHPLYEGELFVGTVGLDLLLPTITDRVLELKPGQGGYAFLVAATGKLIAVPEAGIADLTWDPVHQQALRQTLVPADEQRWAPELVQALGQQTLDRSPDLAVRELVAGMQSGQADLRELVLSGRRVLVSYAPIASSGWSLGVVTPVAEALASNDAVRAAIHSGTAALAERFVLIVGVLLLFGALAGVAVHRLTTRPLQRLARSVEGLSWDKLELHGADLMRRDEVGTLYRRFAEALGWIREARDALTHEQADLEQANQRLSQANAELGREVGERRRAELALSREKDLLAVTLRSIGDGVIATDAQGRVRLLNAVAEQIIGLTEAAALGRAVGQVLQVGSADAGSDADALVRTVLTGDRLQVAERSATLRSHDGEERSLALSAAPIQSAGQAPVGAILVFRDQTEARRIENELARVQRLETVQVLAAGIAHDFNNLLFGILGNVSLARAEIDSASEAQALLERAEGAVERARQLTVQLLTFSKGGAPQRRPVDLRQLIPDTASFMLRGKSIRQEFVLDEDLWSVLADPGQVGQVIQNLVLNAEQALGGQGVIRVEADNAMLLDGQVHDLQAGRYVCVSVVDCGPGVQPALRSRIFEPFVSTKASGSGLGLAVCFSVLHKHDGHIEVLDTPGGGATFRFWLPAADALPAPTAALELPHGRGRILVMDDDELVRKVAEHMLPALGYSVVTVADGEQAVQAVRDALARGQRFTACLLDLTVRGGMGGAQALPRLRALDPDLVAVVSSGYSSDDIMAHPRAAGFDGRIAKPYTRQQLAEVLDEVLRGV